MFKEETGKSYRVSNSEFILNGDTDLTDNSPDGTKNSWRLYGKCDGYVDEGIIEVKSRQEHTVMRDEPYPQELIQVQTYLHLLASELCYFVQYKDTTKVIKVCEVQKDDTMWEEQLRPGLQTFVRDLQRLLSRDPQHNKFKLYVLLEKKRNEGRTKSHWSKK